MIRFRKSLIIHTSQFKYRQAKKHDSSINKTGQRTMKTKGTIILVIIRRTQMNRMSNHISNQDDKRTSDDLWILLVVQKVLVKSAGHSLLLSITSTIEYDSFFYVLLLFFSFRMSLFSLSTVCPFHHLFTSHLCCFSVIYLCHPNTHTRSASLIMDSYRSRFSVKTLCNYAFYHHKTTLIIVLQR